MWKRSESETPEPVPAASPTPVASAQPSDRSVLGSSLKIKGDLSGTEDLVVQGQVEGKVDLKKNSVTVGKNGRVKADIYAESIYIEGEVQGNLYGSEKVVIRKSGSVLGNISGPRVNLEDGARFKGSIDMDGGQEKSQSGSSASSKDQDEKDDKKSVTARSDSKTQSSREEEKPSLGFKVGSSSSKP